MLRSLSENSRFFRKVVVAVPAPCGSMCIEVQNIRGYYWPEPFRLLKSPEYLLRAWSFLTARPRAFLCPTTTSNRLARVMLV